jgi:hypothetical protein
MIIAETAGFSDKGRRFGRDLTPSKIRAFGTEPEMPLKGAPVHQVSMSVAAEIGDLSVGRRPEREKHGFERIHDVEVKVTVSKGQRLILPPLFPLSYQPWPA